MVRKSTKHNNGNINRYVIDNLHIFIISVFYQRISNSILYKISKWCGKEETAGLTLRTKKEQAKVRGAGDRIIDINCDCDYGTSREDIFITMPVNISIMSLYIFSCIYNNNIFMYC